MDMIPEFGKQIRNQEFTLGESVTFVNHGSYGVVPKRIQEAQRRILSEMNNYPDLFFRRNLRLKMDEARTCIAKFVNADPDDIVFVQNATTGINTVLRSLKFESRDVLLCTDNSYQAVKNACESATNSSHVTDVRTEYLSLKFPIQDEDQVVDMYRDYLKRTPQVKLAIIDHITSPSAIKMPIEKLTQLCKEFGVLTLIDGAHAPGQIPIDIKILDVDFYTGNLHKWLYAPRGCAILYIKREHQDWIKPVITSHGHNKDLQTDFFHQGTRDDSPYCVVPEAIQLFHEFGGYEKIQSYADVLLDKATKLLTTSWKTEKLPIPKSMEAPCMRMVQLPDLPAFRGLSTYEELETLIIDHIVNNNVSCQYTFVDGKVYVRLSANIYSTAEDYERLCRFILSQMKNQTNIL